MSHAYAGVGDCVDCHTAGAGVTWASGPFSHLPAPSACAGCHAGARPTGPVGTPLFDHANGGMGDCKSCHQVYSATRTDWSGDSFSHSPAPASCDDCHLAIRPVGPAGNRAFDHANGGAGDCMSCHLPKSATPTEWSGATFSHEPAPSSCLGCHVGDRRAEPVGFPPFDHAIAGMGDCKARHAVRSATQTDWHGGTCSHSPVPAECTTCHAITRPAANASSFDHTLPGLADCTSSHAFGGQKWTGASAVPSVVILTPPTGKTWPNLTAPHPVIDPSMSGLTCATCHGTNTGAKIIDYDHAKPVTGGKWGEP
jgi:hypothetical protein